MFSFCDKSFLRFVFITYLTEHKIDESIYTHRNVVHKKLEIFSCEFFSEDIVSANSCIEQCLILRSQLYYEERDAMYILTSFEKHKNLST